MKFRVETITPDRARRLLDRTESLGFTNRTISKRRVDKLAHAIVEGQWQVTHQGIAIGPDGGVIDGQHRLRAVVVADQAVKMLVVRETEPETFKVVDTGTARTTADSLKIAGFPSPNNVSAITRGVIAYRDVMGTTDNFARRILYVTTTDVTEFLEDEANREAVLYGLQVGRRVAGQLSRFGLTSSLGIGRALISLVPNELGDATVSEFYERLGDGEMLSGQSPILALRRWFMSDTGYSRTIGQSRRETTVAILLKSLNDYALGRARHIAIFRVGVEPFPAPLPKGSRRRLERELEEAEAASEHEEAREAI